MNRLEPKTVPPTTIPQQGIAETSKQVQAAVIVIEGPGLQDSPKHPTDQVGHS